MDAANSLLELLAEFTNRIPPLLWAISWQTTVLVALIAVVAFFARRASASFRYALWCIVLIRLCLPVSLSLPMGMATWGGQSTLHASAIETVPSMQADNSLPPFAVPSEFPMHEELAFQFPDFSPTGAAWVISVFALFIALLWHTRRMCGVVRTLPTYAGRSELHTTFPDLCKRLGINRPVTLCSAPDSQRFNTPMVIGIFRPKVILPRTMTETWSMEDLEPVLAHELAHIRRNDLLVNWLQIILQVVYFFHPLVWLANWQIRREREWVCDDIAVSHLNGRRADYSRSILRVLEQTQSHFSLVTAGIGMAERRNSLRQRIVRIMDKKYKVHRRMGMLSIAGLVIVGGICIALASEPTAEKHRLSSEVSPSKSPDESAGRYTETVIIGTHYWDLESDRQDKEEKADFWWEQVNDKARFLVPKNGAKLKLLPGADFDKIDLPFIQAQDLTERSLSGSDEKADLTPGTVVVFKTGEGNFGKLQVVKYRALHDFTFPEAIYIEQKWKDFVLKKPNKENYHLQVRWQLSGNSKTPALGTKQHCSATIVDDNNKPLAKIRVRLFYKSLNAPSTALELEKRTDVQGKVAFDFEKVEKGYGQLICDEPGYDLAFACVAPPPVATAVSIVLHKSGEPWRGKVVDEEGKPVTGADVRVGSWSQGPFREENATSGSMHPALDLPDLRCRTDANGEFTLDRFSRNDSLGVNVSAPLHMSIEAVFDGQTGFTYIGGWPVEKMRASRDTKGVFTMYQGADLRGRVVMKSTGKPFPFAENSRIDVTANIPLQSRSPITRWSWLQPDGSFVIRGLQPFNQAMRLSSLSAEEVAKIAGEKKLWQVRFSSSHAEGRKYVWPDPIDMDIELGETREIVIAVEEGIRVSGRVIDAGTKESPTAWCRIEVTQPANPSFHVYTSITKDGSWETYLPVGEFTLHYYGEAIKGTNTNIVVKPGQPVDCGVQEISIENPTNATQCELGFPITESIPRAVPAADTTAIKGQQMMTPVSFDCGQAMPLGEFLNNLTFATGVKFVIADGKRVLVTGNWNGTPLKEVLQAVLHPNGLMWELRGEIVVIIKASENHSDSLPVTSQPVNYGADLRPVAADGAARMFDFKGDPNVVAEIVKRYGIRHRQFDGKESLVFGSTLTEKLKSLEEEALRARGVDLKTAHIKKIVFGIIHGGDTWDLGVTSIEMVPAPAARKTPVEVSASSSAPSQTPFAARALRRIAGASRAATNVSP